MVKDKAANKSEGEKDKESNEYSTRSLSSFEHIPIERTIDLIINTIENITREESINIMICVQHNDSTLGESDVVMINPDRSEPSTVNDINYTVQFPMTINCRSSMDAVVSTPVLIRVMESPVLDKEIYSSAEVSGDAKETAKGKTSAKSATVIDTMKIMGISSLDVMPLLLGEKCVTEKLIVEKPNFLYDDTIVSSWSNFPLLTITMRQEETDFFPPDMPVNFLNITVESIYNPLPSFTDNLDYKAGTVIYVDSETSEDVIFEGGKWTSVRDDERTKCWQTLYGLDSRAKLSKYKINCDNEGIKKQFEIDLQKKLVENVPRIEWNSMRRCMILRTGIQVMQDHINRYKYWPFQFTMMSNLEGNRAKSKDLFKPQIYQCYVDVSELLYPGKTRARTVAQLYTYNVSELKEKSGIERGVFDAQMAKETKEKERKGRTSTKGGSTFALVSPEVELTSSLPLTLENGEPVFVIIEFELHNPLIKARTLTDLTNILDKMVTPPEPRPAYPYTINLAEDQYFNCIRKLVDIISERYRDFVEYSNNQAEAKDEKASSTSTTRLIKENEESFDPSKQCGKSERSEQQKCPYSYIPDELSCFVQYLYDTGAYLSIRSALKSKIILLLDQKFRIERTLDSKESQNFVAAAYVYLVEQMHVALNKGVDGQFAKESTEIINPMDIYLHAEEAYEMGHVREAKNYYTTMIAEDRNNSDAWLKYAIFLIKIKDTDRAIECCRKAIALSSRHKIALLLYGIILAGNGRNREAEIFLKAITQLYPRFTEGWAILHLFYLQTEYFPGIDLTIQIAEKCLKDKSRETFNVEYLKHEPLSWPMFQCPKDRIYILTAILLLKLNCYNFAGTALAQEMSIVGKSIPLLYYMAVHHYLLCKHKDALSYLEEIQYQYGMDYSISSLMGHCHYKEGNFKDATYCYEFANSTFDRPDDLHLVQTRLGNYYLDNEQYDSAKRIFLRTCKASPTSKTWLGVGIAYYYLNQFKEAEMALTEANRIDSRNSDIWGYLCLLNLSLQRYDEFTQCYRQAIKHNLKNVKLWLMITRLMEKLGYSVSMLSAATGKNVNWKAEETREQEKLWKMKGKVKMVRKMKYRSLSH